MAKPVSLTRRDGKRPDEMTRIPWRSGKMLVWDVTAVSTVADLCCMSLPQPVNVERWPNSLLPEMPEILRRPFSIHFPSNRQSRDKSMYEI